MNRSRITTYKTLLFGALFTATLTAGAGAAHAAMSLDYALDSSNPLASIYYNPLQDGMLHGSNIAVTNITGIDTTLNTGPGNALSISSGALNFITGAFSKKTIGQNFNIWEFNGGGSISVTGGISQLSIASGSTLLNGSFSSATVTEFPLLGQLKFDIVGAAFNDVDHQLIYNHFNIPTDFASSEGMNLSFIANGAANGGFASSSIASGNIVDVPTPTPLPAAAWLLGSGLMGLVGIRRKKINP